MKNKGMKLIRQSVEMRESLNIQASLWLEKTSIPRRMLRGKLK